MAFMLLGFIIGMGQLNTANDTTRLNMQASDYQREYAKLSRYEGDNIPYTEVLDCIYNYSASVFPVIVTTQASMADEDTYSIPLTHDKLEDWKSMWIVGGKTTQYWTGIPSSGSGSQTYADLARYLSTVVSDPNTLEFGGHILRTENGTAYGIVFFWDPPYTP